MMNTIRILCQIYISSFITFRAKIIIRVKRYIAAPKALKPSLENFFSTYQDLNYIEIKDESRIMKAFELNNIDPFDQPNMVVIDPIGNIILHYSGEVDGKKLLTDLKKLLGASKIG